jgi:hypothetical protein
MASVLETFLLLFDSDASNVKKGAEDAKKSTESLNSSLKNTGVISQQVGKRFVNMVRNVGAGLVAFASIGAAFTGFKSAKDYAYSLSTISYALNLNIEDVNAWVDALKLYGGSASTFEHDISHLTTELETFVVTGKSRVSPYFKELGIRMTDASGKAREAIKILPELADRFGKLSKTESFALGKKLGLDTYTILLLQQGKRELDDLIKRQKELGTVTEKDIEVIYEFNKQWEEVAHIFRTLYNEIGRTIFPALTLLLKGVEKVVLFMRKHSEFATAAFITMGLAISLFLVPAIKSLWVAIAPFAKLAAVITAVGFAVAFLVEDIIYYVQGHDSFIGRLVEKWPKLGKVIAAIGWVAKRVFEGLQDAFKAIEVIADAVYEIIKYIVNAIAEGIGDTIDAIGVIIDKALEYYNKIKGFLTGGFDGKDATVSLKAANQTIQSANTSPISNYVPNIPGGITSNSKATTVNTGPITINTQATDSEQISKSLGNSLKVEMRQTLNNFDDGVAA